MSAHPATLTFMLALALPSPRLMRDASDVNGAHTTAVASLRQQLATAEQAVVEEEASASRMQVRGILCPPHILLVFTQFCQSLVHTLSHW